MIYHIFNTRINSWIVLIQITANHIGCNTKTVFAELKKEKVCHSVIN